MADTYIAQDGYCSEDTECTTVHYVGGSPCGGTVVSQSGVAGHELLLENAEYQRFAEIVKDSLSCGPIPLCSPLPPGSLKCVSNQCAFVPDVN